MESKRLRFRKMIQADFSDLCKILQDDEVMYAYEGAFSDEMAQSWLDNQIKRYNENGLGLYAVILKETDEFIGQCGLTKQMWDDTEVLEVGYLFNKEYWHMGYATEAAVAWKEYAFNELGAAQVYSIIRETNIPSQNVAIRNGMEVAGSTVKHYRGFVMPHFVYVAYNK